ASAWCLIAMEQSRAGDSAGAAKSLQSAASSIASASGAHRITALAQIAKAQAQLNDPVSASATLDLARSAAPSTTSADAEVNDRALVEAEVRAGAWDSIEQSDASSAAARCRAFIAAADREGTLNLGGLLLPVKLDDVLAAISPNMRPLMNELRVQIQLVSVWRVLSLSIATVIVMFTTGCGAPPPVGVHTEDAINGLPLAGVQVERSGKEGSTIVGKTDAT